MRYVCDAPRTPQGVGRTWFSIETQAEADAESAAMRHAVAKFFERAIEQAKESYEPRPGLALFERDIGLKDHIEKMRPLFLTLRSDDGEALVTAMLPSRSAGPKKRIIIVAPDNADPYPEHADAIRALGDHVGLRLDRATCYPYS